MLTPAQLLLIERLIQILTDFLCALDRAAEDGKFNLRRTGARFLIARVTDRLTRLRESNRAADPDESSAPPIHAPQPRRGTRLIALLVALPATHPLQPLNPAPRATARLQGAPLVPLPHPHRLKPRPAARLTHVHLVALS